MGGIHLGHYLTEKQEEEGEEDGDAQELQPICTTEVDDMGKEIVTEHDDGYIHQVIGDEDSGKSEIRIIEKLDYFAVGVDI